MLGNLDIGSIVIGWGRWAMRGEQGRRPLPLITIEQEPQTSSRQAASQTTGVVFSPFAVTGRFWISIRQLITFMEGRYGISNSSQYDSDLGSSRRLILNWIVEAISISSALA